MKKLVLLLGLMVFGLGGCFYPFWRERRREVIVVPERERRAAPMEERHDRHEQDRRDDHGR